LGDIHAESRTDRSYEGMWFSSGLGIARIKV